MSEQITYTVYALESEVNGMLYVGFTEDIDRRIKEHNSGKNKFTKGYKPCKLVFTETVSNRLLARKREKYLKGGVGKEWLKNMIKMTP